MPGNCASCWAARMPKRHRHSEDASQPGMTTVCPALTASLFRFGLTYTPVSYSGVALVRCRGEDSGDSGKSTGVKVTGTHV
jgi:hypothetical protein